MKVRLHQIKGQVGFAVYIPKESQINVKHLKKGDIILKIPYKATTQNRILVKLEGKKVDAWID